MILVKCLRAIVGVVCFWPKTGLFVEFDQHFLGFDSRGGAIALSTWLLNQKVDGIDISHLALHFPDWPPRRLTARLIISTMPSLFTSLEALDSSPWTMVCLHVTDHTRRFVHNHS